MGINIDEQKKTGTNVPVFFCFPERAYGSTGMVSSPMVRLSMVSKGMISGRRQLLVQRVFPSRSPMLLALFPERSRVVPSFRVRETGSDRIA